MDWWIMGICKFHNLSSAFKIYHWLSMTCTKWTTKNLCECGQFFLSSWCYVKQFRHDWEKRLLNHIISIYFTHHFWLPLKLRRCINNTIKRVGERLYFLVALVFKSSDAPLSYVILFRILIQPCKCFHQNISIIFNSHVI